MQKRQPKVTCMNIYIYIYIYDIISWKQYSSYNLRASITLTRRNIITNKFGFEDTRPMPHWIHPLRKTTKQTIKYCYLKYFLGIKLNVAPAKLFMLNMQKIEKSAKRILHICVIYIIYIVHIIYTIYIL